MNSDEKGETAKLDTTMQAEETKTSQTYHFHSLSASSSP